mmetsp:Transcript_76608/g.159386  ORF Transcript_76608/g.159386 Transcript_76608/m.159386 type:complete len:343 (-) Transcript_76608:233-1261(-)|eukprot:CAMPEP_0206466462 /NCGR_PEP_ID=MMETSP0324_2-20121206/28469_1 /ASSEMBLY_ACC=CAM_ASM_000836 /TAXON_ID=2866 /ORGANISM="Crypthecodinium cohnii, Strain Seligo" /LENGTH=342 /DNA_ID=CAMNT_0053939575 /DNA_START=146 /DNA_END=1174 /DNA_ORIENTATION=+
MAMPVARTSLAVRTLGGVLTVSAILAAFTFPSSSASVAAGDNQEVHGKYDRATEDDDDLSSFLEIAVNDSHSNDHAAQRQEAGHAGCDGQSCSSTKATQSLETPFMNQEGCLSFIHIPKTGGGSIEEESRRQNLRLFNNSTDPKYRFWGAADHHLTCKGMFRHSTWPFARRCPLNEHGGKDCEIYHKPPSFDDTLLESYRPCQTFCVIRNPLDRLVSEFKYHHGEPDLCFDALFNDWATDMLKRVRGGQESIGGCHFLQQYDYVFDSQGGRICDHILNFTSLHEDFAQLMQSRGSDATLDDHHVHRMTDVMDCTVNANSTVKAMVADMYKSDFEAFGFYMPQ